MSINRKDFVFYSKTVKFIFRVMSLTAKPSDLVGLLLPKLLINKHKVERVDVIKFFGVFCYAEINFRGFHGIFAYPRKFVSAKVLKFFYSQK